MPDLLGYCEEFLRPDKKLTDCVEEYIKGFSAVLSCDSSSHIIEIKGSGAFGRGTALKGSLNAKAILIFRDRNEKNIGQEIYYIDTILRGSFLKADFKKVEYPDPDYSHFENEYIKVSIPFEDKKIDISMLPALKINKHEDFKKTMRTCYYLGSRELIRDDYIRTFIQLEYFKETVLILKDWVKKLLAPFDEFFVELIVASVFESYGEIRGKEIDSILNACFKKIQSFVESPSSLLQDPADPLVNLVPNFFKSNPIKTEVVNERVSITMLKLKNKAENWEDILKSLKPCYTDRNPVTKKSKYRHVIKSFEFCENNDIHQENVSPAIPDGNSNSKFKFIAPNSMT
jgi:hypothetical protein